MRPQRALALRIERLCRDSLVIDDGYGAPWLVYAVGQTASGRWIFEAHCFCCSEEDQAPLRCTAQVTSRRSLVAAMSRIGLNAADVAHGRFFELIKGRRLADFDAVAGTLAQTRALLTGGAVK